MYYNLSLNPSLFLDSEDETHAYELMIIDILYFYRLVAFSFFRSTEREKINIMLLQFLWLKNRKKEELRRRKKTSWAAIIYN